MSALHLLTVAVMVCLVQASLNASHRRSSRAAGGGAEVKLGPGNKPDCAKDALFCTDTPDYPKELIAGALTNADAFKDFFGVEKSGDVASRIGQDTQFCDSRSQVIFPKVAQNKDNEWLFIVNLENEYRQGIAVEMCSNPGGKCRLSDQFPHGYGTECQQKFIYRKLIAIGKDQKPAHDSFRLPSCCVCHFHKTSK